jgi:hypothetical protein
MPLIRTSKNNFPTRAHTLQLTQRIQSLIATGGPIDICTLCEVLKCDLNPHLGSSWLENKPRFTAINFMTGGKSTLFVTMPGEPLSELGKQVRGDGLDLGFDDVFLYVLGSREGQGALRAPLLCCSSCKRE